MYTYAQKLKRVFNAIELPPQEPWPKIGGTFTQDKPS